MGKRAKLGDIVRIGFDDNLHTYGLILFSPYVAVYDLPSVGEVADMTEIADRPILFIVAAHHQALVDWPTVGKAPEGRTLPTVPEFFVQDSFNPHRCKIVDAEGNSRQVEPQDCIGLERAAVWETGHVAGRIRDYYEGRRNAYLESMKLQL